MKSEVWHYFTKETDAGHSASNSLEEDDMNVSAVENDEMSLLQEYEREINKVSSADVPEKACSGFNANAEFKCYETTLVKSHNLKKLQNALLSIKATSVESERAFSAAGLFITKVRSRLSAETIDGLCFTKSYLKSEKTQSK